MTIDLFYNTKTSHSIEITGAELLFYPNFFDLELADLYFHELLKNIIWKQENITLYGKQHKVPRLTAWYADVGKSYEYSGIHATAIPWIYPLIDIKEKIESVSGEKFNSVLINQYRNGADGVAWHSDDESELGNEPVIASISLGEIRPFQLMNKKNKTLKHSIDLPHGSLLLMSGKTQQNYLHQIPKSSRSLQTRINLTFRFIE